MSKISPFHFAGRPDARWQMQQAEGRERLRLKVPSWASVEALHYPVRLSVEQCSSEVAARYKAEVAQRLCPLGGRFVDLTGGFGVDFAFVAQAFSEARYVERNADLVAIVRHNLPLLGLPTAEVCHGDGVAVLQTMSPVDLLLLDPARRDTAGRKTVLLADCEPNVVALHDLLRAKSRWTMLKLSPMLDVAEALRGLPSVAEVHIVAVGGECKDLLLVLGERSPADAPIPIHCIDTPHRFSFTIEEEATAVAPLATTLETYLFEPSPAVLKAGAFRTLCTRFGVKKLHPNTHLYTASEDVPAFPGRRFRIDAVSGFSKKEIRPLTGQKANLAVRNFPQSVGTLRTKLRLLDGGDAYWFATTMGEREHLLVRTHKLPVE